MKLLFNVKSNRAFTIVELLVVIVVIAVLAAISFVSFSGISNRANQSAIISELSQASKKLAMYYTEYGTYPTSLDPTTACPTLPTADTNYCPKFRNGTTFNYVYKTPSTYELVFRKDSLDYKVTESTTPTTTTLVTAIATPTGTTTVEQTLTAGALTPAAATASYQWQRATTSNGTYTNIPTATSSTYTLTPADANKYIKVIATGTGSYGGSQTSAASAQIATGPNWLTIGSQTWAKYNLNVGTRIAGATNQTNNANLEKYCYADTESNCATYGGLYQWDEAMQYSTSEGAQGICPVGSHIPTDNEWKVLEMQLGMSQAQADATLWRGTDEGTKLKSGGSSGLNMPLAGFRDPGGTFYNLPSDSYLWSSSESNSSAWYRALDASYVTVVRNVTAKSVGFSIRCLGN